MCASVVYQLPPVLTFGLLLLFLFSCSADPAGVSASSHTRLSVRLDVSEQLISSSTYQSLAWQAIASMPSTQLRVQALLDELAAHQSASYRSLEQLGTAAPAADMYDMP
jgi:hypothetical protein